MKLVARQRESVDLAVLEQCEDFVRTGAADNARRIETAYATMWETWRAGRPPGSFSVD